MHRPRMRSAALTAILAVTAAPAVFTASPATAATGPNTTAAAQASLVRLHIGERATARACSGTLVDGQWVLTAASCFSADPASPAQLTAGKPAWKTIATVGRSTQSGSGGHTAEVVELVPAPGRDLVMARLATPAAGMAPLGLAVSPAGAGDVVQATGFGRSKTEWIPGAAHSAQMKVGTVSDTELLVAGVSAGDAVCKGDTGAPLLREVEGRTEVVGVATRSRQGGCLSESETGTDAAATRTDDMGDWVASTMGRSYTRLMTAADMNGDKKADLLTIDAADQFLYVQPGDGKGKFGERIQVSPGKWTGMRILTAADFSGDGNTDVLAANTNGSLYLYFGNGKNALTSNTVARTGWNTVRLTAAGDFNGDKKADVIGVAPDNNLYFYAGQGTTFAGAVKASTGWPSMRAIATGDFNGDGKADAMAVHNTGDLYLYTGKGDGTFNNAVKKGSGWQVMRLVSGGDFNGDGKGDIVAVHTNGSIYAYPGNGAGGFTTPVVTAPPKQTTELIRNGGFDTSTTAWWATERASVTFDNGTLLATVEADAASPWEAIAGQSAIVLRKGATYTLTFDAKASAAASLRTTVQLGDAPYTATLDQVTALDTSFNRYTYTFTSTVDTPNGALNFQIGGNPLKTAITFDNVSLTTTG